MKKNYLRLFGLLALTTQLSFSQEVTDTIKTQNIEEIKINSKKIKIDKNQTPSQIEIISKEDLMKIRSFKNFLKDEKLFKKIAHGIYEKQVF